MRMGFWRGVLTGTIVGAAVSMISGGRNKMTRKGFLGNSTKQAKTRANRMLRGVSKTVNNLIK